MGERVEKRGSLWPCIHLPIFSKWHLPPLQNCSQRQFLYTCSICCHQEKSIHTVLQLLFFSCNNLSCYLFTQSDLGLERYTYGILFTKMQIVFMCKSQKFLTGFPVFLMFFIIFTSFKRYAKYFQWNNISNSNASSCIGTWKLHHRNCKDFGTLLIKYC